MTDFEMMLTVFDRSQADFHIVERDFPPYDGEVRKSIRLVCDNSGIISGRINNIKGYDGFTCHFVFNADGALDDIFIWE